MAGFTQVKENYLYILLPHNILFLLSATGTQEYAHFEGQLIKYYLYICVSKDDQLLPILSSGN